MTATLANYEYVADQDRFAQLCGDWLDSPSVGLDTEFIRTRTFYPKTGLLQFCVDSRCFLVDPLKISDWEPCRKLLAGATMVIHAAGEDLGLLQHLLGAVPAKLFDTQLAAAFLGVGFSLSYRDLVSEFCGIDLPKSETRSNWLQRPLSTAQLQYAAADVRFLPALWQKLGQRLDEEQKLDWFTADCRELTASAIRNEDPRSWREAWRQINDHELLDDRGLLLLQRLCRWREKEVRARDLPRNWLVADRDLVALARGLEGCRNIGPEKIRNAAGANPKFASRFAASLTRCLNEPDEDLAQPPSRRQSPAFGRSLREQLKLWRNLAQREASRIRVCPELLVRRRQMQQLVQSHALTGSIDWPPEMRGWRKRLLEPVLAAELPASEQAAETEVI